MCTCLPMYTFSPTVCGYRIAGAPALDYSCMHPGMNLLLVFALRHNDPSKKMSTNIQNALLASHAPLTAVCVRSCVGCLQLVSQYETCDYGEQDEEGPSVRALSLAYPSFQRRAPFLPTNVE